MIGITKLYCGAVTAGDALRYGRWSKDLPVNLLQFSSDKKPIVVWNSTRRCNLKCIHCYADSENKAYPNELELRGSPDDDPRPGEFGAPVLLFSGGEPLIRQDMFEHAELAKSFGIRPVISTNGTLITEEMARRIKETGFGYVGISLDGIGKRNDFFRGKTGAFEAAMRRLRQLRRRRPEVRPPAHAHPAQLSSSSTRYSISSRSTRSTARASITWSTPGGAAT